MQATAGVSSLFTSITLLMVLATVGASAQTATIHNLTQTTSFAPEVAGPNINIPLSTYTNINNQQSAGTVINNAIFIPYVAASGSGTYRRLFQIDGKTTSIDPVDGYNRDAGNKNNDFESSTPNGFDPNLTVGAMQPNNGYYQFSLDINEPNNGNRWLSVDRLRIYVENTTPGSDFNPLPKTFADLGNLGTLVYDMDAGADNAILLDFSLAPGSGDDDMTFLIPTSLFTGFDANAFVYLYAEHGAQGTYLDGFEANAGGFDEWAVKNDIDDPTVPFTPPVPEPSTLVLLGMSTLALLRRRR